MATNFNIFFPTLVWSCISSLDNDELLKECYKHKKNNPNSNDGIKQTWEFAHPNNQKATGPLPNFINMINGVSYKMLLNHISHELSMVYSSDDRYAFEVKILDKEKKYFQFQWVVEKYLKDGPLKNCWLTTAVSAPMPLGSSI